MLMILNLDKKQIVLLGTFFGLILLSITVYTIYSLDKEGKEFANKLYGIKELKKVEDSFEKEPTIEKGIVLLEKYTFLFKDYDKALSFGKDCLKLGADKNEAGWMVNLWLSKIYYEKNNFDLSKFHLARALELDTKGLIITNKSIHNLGLEEVYSTMSGQHN